MGNSIKIRVASLGLQTMQQVLYTKCLSCPVTEAMLCFVEQAMTDVLQQSFAAALAHVQNYSQYQPMHQFVVYVVFLYENIGTKNKLQIVVATELRHGRR